ncbi:MAG: Dephospho-CoA kinase [Acidobacteria bacterium ADurb.Bin051]|jgi:dephospho-CoA kinase|nr:dephospho-CoA kinase [Acidobacteriota bacterium]OQC38912.1 MAG: Dephospho-CoA kinase [Acidobacteria bacterium ADurb.Bin051]
MARLRVGLTGGLASGKSTVGRLLAARPGFLVVDADRLVAELYEPGGEGAAAVAALCGPAYLTPGGGVDKRALAARFFEDETLRRRLEAAIHPLVLRRFLALAAAHDGIAVLEATRLVEAGYRDQLDLVVTVEAPEPLRLARAVARGLSEADARARLAAQGDGASRRAASDLVLENDADLAHLEALVDRLAGDLVTRAGRNA